MVGAWCSADSKKAITNLKDGKNPNLNFCDSQPVAKHYAIGKKLGVTGTPAIITKTGDLLPGYYSAEDLLKKLKG
jgi:thiol:disulfide interchange protein DsbC